MYKNQREVNTAVSSLFNILKLTKKEKEVIWIMDLKYEQ